MDELTSMDTRDVFNEMMPSQLNKKYWPKGVRTEAIPATSYCEKPPT